jgi:hypothetical protein
MLPIPTKSPCQVESKKKAVVPKHAMKKKEVVAVELFLNLLGQIFLCRFAGADFLMKSAPSDLN